MLGLDTLLRALSGNRWEYCISRTRKHVTQRLLDSSMRKTEVKTPFRIIPPVDTGNIDPVPGIPCQFNIHLALRSMASAKFLSHQSSPITPGPRTSTANIPAPACAREPTANHWPGGVCRGLSEICRSFNRQNQLVCTWGSI